MPGEAVFLFLLHSFEFPNAAGQGHIQRRVMFSTSYLVHECMPVTRDCMLLVRDLLRHAAP